MSLCDIIVCMLFVCHFYDVFFSLYIPQYSFLAIYLQIELKMVSLTACLRSFFAWFGVTSFCNLFDKVIQGMFDCSFRMVTEHLWGPTIVVIFFFRNLILDLYVCGGFFFNPGL